jgi:hypothetical protein
VEGRHAGEGIRNLLRGSDHGTGQEEVTEDDDRLRLPPLEPEGLCGMDGLHAVGPGCEYLRRCVARVVLADEAHVVVLEQPGAEVVGDGAEPGGGTIA